MCVRQIASTTAVSSPPASPVFATRWLEQECLDLSVRTGAMLDAARHHEQLTRTEDNVSVTELDGGLTVDHEEQLVCRRERARRSRP